MDLGLAGRKAFVTGGSRGIGREIACRLAEEGCDVAICARGQADLAEAEREVTALGARCLAIPADVSDPGAAAAAVDHAAAGLGGLDLVVANVGAAIGPPRFLETTPEQWLATYRLDVVHVVAVLRAAVPHLRERGGAAVAISSVSAARPGPWPQYGAAKAALAQIAALQPELAPLGVRLNVVSPGSIMFEGGGWDRYRAAEPGPFAEFVGRELPWGRLGTPAEVADVVAFLLSDRASWVSGAIVPVDGAQGRPSPYPEHDDH